MESEKKEMRTELEHRIEELQAELRASKMTEEQTTLQLVEMQHEMHKHKDSAAGQAFASKIHQVMANKNKQRADDLGQQLGGLETASEAQQGKYENLSKLHETLLTEKRELATKADQLDAELREEKSKNRDLTAAQLKLQTQFAKCQEEAEKAKLRGAALDEQISASESEARNLDDENWKLKESLKDIESQLKAASEDNTQLQKDLDRERETKVSVEARLREVEIKCQEQAREAKQQLRDMSSENQDQVHEYKQQLRELEMEQEREKRELELHANEVRDSLEREQHEMRIELEGKLADLQAELRASKMTEEQTTMQLAEMEREMHKHKDSAAGQAFASKIHQVMANKSKQAGHQLNEQNKDLEHASEAQHAQYEQLMRMHEGVLAEKRDLQASLAKSEASRKSMEALHTQEMAQLRDILDGLLRCSSVLSREAQSAMHSR